MNNTHESGDEDAHAGEGKDNLRSWIVCFCVSCNLALVNGYLVASSSVFFVALLEELGETKETTAWVMSISNAMVCIPGPLAAFLGNRYGNRNIAMCGSVIYASGVFVSSFSPNILVLCVTFSFMGGLGGGMIFNTSFIAIANSFEKHRDFAFGLVHFGLSIGYIPLPTLVRYTIDSVGLWTTYRIISGTCLLSFGFCFVYPKPSSAHVENKDSLGFQLSVLKIPSFRAVTALHFLAFLGFYVPFQHMLRYAEEQGVSKERSYFFMVYFGIATCLSRLAVSKIIDIFKRIDFLALYISQASLITLGIASIIICHTRSFYAFLGYFIVYGLLDGGFVTLHCATVFRCVGPRCLPMAWGIFTFCYAIAVIFGAPIGGLLADVFKSYQPTFYFAGVTMIVPGILLFIVAVYSRGETNYGNTVEPASS